MKMGNGKTYGSDNRRQADRTVANDDKPLADSVAGLLFTLKAARAYGLQLTSVTFAAAKGGKPMTIDVVNRAWEGADCDDDA